MDVCFIDALTNLAIQDLIDEMNLVFRREMNQKQETIKSNHVTLSSSIHSNIRSSIHPLLTHSLTLTLTHSLTQSITLSIIIIPSLTHSLTHSIHHSTTHTQSIIHHFLIYSFIPIHPPSNN